MRVNEIQSCFDTSRFDTSLFTRGENSSTYLAYKAKIFTQNVVSCSLATILEVNKIFVQFHCLSLYRNDPFPRI